MTRDEYALYIQSEDWQQRRKQFITDRHNACERCKLPRWVARLVYDQDLNVHHRNYQRLGNEQPEDVTVLCRRCHDIESLGRSNYREIETARCSCCEAKHWNIYSEHCEGCARQIAVAFWNARAEWLGMPKDGNSPFDEMAESFFEKEPRPQVGSPSL